MKKLVIIGANDFQNQLILKAKGLGYETHVFAWEDGAVGKNTADYFYPISIVEKEEILEKCKEIKPDGVCSIASDLAAITVNYVAENLGLPCNKFSTVKAQTNKFSMRKKLFDHGVKCPFFCETDGSNLDELKDTLPYPVIVKPTDRSGSRSICKVESAETLEQAVKNACESSFENGAIIEEYINGNEYSCECITQNGVHHFLTFTKKYTTGSPAFIETGHRQPSDIPESMQAKIRDEIFKALDALEVKNSASHTEFRIDGDDFNIIEIGARMGGDCIGSDLVYLSTGYDFVKMVIDVAVGNEIDLSQAKHHNVAKIKFIFDKKDYDEMLEFKNKYPEKIYRISDIDTEAFGNATDSSSRAGYYIVTE